MRLKAFTIIEMLIAIIIVGVLATLAINGYQGFIENADAQVCEAHQKAVVTFINSYAMEHDTMPADYSQLPREGLEKAYANILRQKGGWKIRLASFITGWKDQGFAYAGGPTSQYNQTIINLVGGNLSLLVCPRNRTGGRSYGFNNNILGITSKAYRQLPDDLVVIADCDNAYFTGSGEFASRHKNYKLPGGGNWGAAGINGYPQGVTKTGKSFTDIAKGLVGNHTVSDVNEGLRQVVEYTDYISFCGNN